MIRVSFWIAVVLGTLSALAIFIQPVIGLVHAGLFALIAWGIRRGQAGAAGTCAVVTSIPALLFIYRRFVEHSSGEPSNDFAALSFIAIYLAIAVVFALSAVHLWRKGNGGKFVAGWAGASAITAVFFLMLQPYLMPTASMENTLLAGDLIMVEKVTASLGRQPRAGDIVVFRYPVDHKQIFTKRVVGLPGDRIRVVHKQLYRNGVAVSEPEVNHKLDYEDSYRDNFPSEPNTPLFPPAQQMLARNVRNGEVVVPPGKYFVMGDNRDQSLDSRYWGFVSKDEMIGRPVFIYGSNDINLNEEQAPSILNTRWHRILRPI